MKHNGKGYRSGQYALTPLQVDTFLSVVSDIRDEALFRLALTGGLRREDIVSVKKKDINFSKGTLTFFEKKKGRIKTICLPASTLLCFEKVLNAFTRERDKRLFPISGKTAYNRFQKYLGRAGLASRPFHSLRATCIKLCQARGWLREQTAELVGDKVSTIEEHYLTPSDEEMRAVASERSLL